MPFTDLCAESLGIERNFGRAGLVLVDRLPLCLAQRAACCLVSRRMLEAFHSVTSRTAERMTCGLGARFRYISQSITCGTDTHGRTLCRRDLQK